MLGLVATATAAGAIVSGSSATAWRLVVRGAGGESLMSVPLPDGRFSLRYRNSVYGSLAEERFVVAPDGRIELVALAADEAAVLDEYYVTDGPRPALPGEARRWVAAPATPLRLEQLPLAVTEHGQRTLVVTDQAIELWHVGAASPATVVLEVERAR